MRDWRKRLLSPPVLLPLALFLLNLFLVRRLLGIEYLDEMGSIEASFIAIARWAREHWNDLNWFPLWYGGIPYVNTYPPLLHRTVAAASALGGLSVPHAYHAVTAVFYSLGPVALYALAVRLGASRAIGFAGGLFYTLVSTSTWLIPAVQRDAGGVWGLRRLQTMVQYGEGPHITSLTLLPLALWLLATAFERRRPVWWFATVLGLAAVPLTNWLGAAALAMAVLAWMLSRPGLLQWKPWVTAAGLGLAAYAIASPFLPPSYIATLAHNERFASGEVAAGSIRLAFAGGGAAVAAASIWLFRRLRLAPALLFAWLLLLATATITLAFEWHGIALVHQAGRYHLEMEMALALTLVFLAQRLLQRAGARTLVALACAGALVAGYGTLRCRKAADRRIRPIAIESTIEYREAKWFERNLPGRRVFAPGSVGFFLNAFTDVPHFAGGVDQSVVNPLWTVAQYQILTGDNAGAAEGEVALSWLKAYGVSAVGVSGPGSRESFKPFHNPRKFEGLLPELWREGDDVIYRIPRRSDSLAHVLWPDGLPPRTPTGGLDMDPVRHYVAALDDPALPPATLTWQSHDRAVIRAALQKGQVVSIQATYHPDWQARVNGALRPVRADNLGQAVIEPDCQGECTIEYLFTPGPETQILRVLSWTCLGIGFVWQVAFVLHRRRRSG